MRNKFFLFLLGAGGYSFLEIASRGFTHWSMAITGGVCFLGILMISQRFVHRSLWTQAALGGALVTGVEFCVGVMVNLILGWQVWDYSDCFGNVLGQVCVQYTFYWCLLSYCVCLGAQIARVLRARIQARVTRLDPPQGDTV